MMIFGGIFEVTKELDDLMVLDLRTLKWYTVFEEASHSPNRRSPNIPPAL
jgi:hypothetical protein